MPQTKYTDEDYQRIFDEYLNRPIDKEEPECLIEWRKRQQQLNEQQTSQSDKETSE